MEGGDGTALTLYYDMVGVLEELSRTFVDIVDKDNPEEFVHIGLIKNKMLGVRQSKNNTWLLKGKIKVGIWNELFPYIQALQANYTRVELKYAFRLGSTYGQKLYDILKSHEFRKGEFTIDLDELRRILAIENKFKLFGDLRRYVLEYGINEINTKTDLHVDWKPIKRGRKFKKIVFRIQSGKGSDIEFLPKSNEDDLFKALRKVGMPEKEAARHVRRLGSEDPKRILWHVAKAIELEKQGKLQKTKLAYIRSGLNKTDYRPQKSLFADDKTDADELREERRKRTQSPRAMGKEGAVDKGMQPVGGVLLEALERAREGREGKPRFNSETQHLFADGI